ncbi:LOW QUALITY PROTEIN: hypothetical protein MAR_017325, partial [Mya arenaria]
VQYNRTKLQRVLKRKVKSSTSGNDSGLSDVKITRSASNPSASFSVFSDKLCFFCDKSISSSDRYKRVASTFALDRKVRKCATDLCDSTLLTKLAGGDMVATEAEYHANCLTSLYKQHAQFLEQSHESNSDGNIHGIVFAELLAYIDEARCDEERPSFRLANLVQLYNNRMEELGVKDSVHATRLKDKILSQIPDLSAHTSKCSQGQGVIFMFNSDVANLVQEANRHRDYDLDAIHIAKAAEIVRLDMFDNVSLFNGIKDQSAKEGSDLQAALTISQMFLFNAVKHSRHASTSGQVRHKADRETPLPLYIGLKLHAATRKKRLVDMMFQLGMSVCYDREQRVVACPHFQYWWLTLKLQLMVLMFVRAERDGNFCLYVETLNKLTPWFFALDQTNYARWLPVHIRDLNTLSQVHPDLHTEFQNGNFVIHKTARVSSGMAIDQGHEQNNAMVKGSGGAVGLTENPSAFRRWMVAGPELARITIEFETAFTAQDDATGHHEQTAVQTAFAKQVMSLVSTIEDMGNPFLEESADLLVMDTKDIVSESVVKTVRNIEQIGVKAYDAYVEQRLVKAEKPISDPIAKQQLPLFSRPQKKIHLLQVADLEVDRELMSQLYVSCQTRAVNQDDFFMYENHPYAPSLSDHGKLRASNKSDLIPCLQSLITPKTDGPTVDCIILDGAAVVHLLAPRTARFVILVYDRTSQLKDVNEVRKDLFTRKGRFKYDSLPPTKAAFTEHAKRATYQGGHVWGQSIRSQMKLPDPAAWGWTKTNDGWEPYWTPLPEASKGCRELIKCGCKKVCTTGRCGCFRAKLSCTTLCSCIKKLPPLPPGGARWRHLAPGGAVEVVLQQKKQHYSLTPKLFFEIASQSMIILMGVLCCQNTAVAWNGVSRGLDCTNFLYSVSFSRSGLTSRTERRTSPTVAADKELMVVSVHVFVHIEPSTMQSSSPALNISTSIQNFSANISTSIQNISANIFTSIQNISANISASIQNISANISASIHNISANICASIQNISASIQNFSASIQNISASIQNTSASIQKNCVVILSPFLQFCKFSQLLSEIDINSRSNWAAAGANGPLPSP